MNLVTISIANIDGLVFITLTILGTSCIICIIVTNAGTICDYISNICLLMGLVKQMGHRSLCIDCNVIAPMTSSLCSFSNNSPEILSAHLLTFFIVFTFFFYLAESNVLRVAVSWVKSFLAAVSESVLFTSYHLSNSGPSEYERVVYGRSSSYTSPLRPWGKLSTAKIFFHNLDARFLSSNLLCLLPWRGNLRLSLCLSDQQ